MGAARPTVRPPPHLPFPKGTKIIHLQWEPPEAIFTVPEEPLVWCKMAMDLPHLARYLPDMPPELEGAIGQEAQTPLAVLARARSEAIQDLHKLRLASKTEESRLRETLDRRVASVTKSKQSLILQQLLDRSTTQTHVSGKSFVKGSLLRMAPAKWHLAHLTPTPDPDGRPALN